MTRQSINSNDGKLLKSFEHLSPAQLDNALSNDSSFGLGGSMWTKDGARGQPRRCRDAVRQQPRLDRCRTVFFGGIKHSGYGRELGRMGIQEFVNKKLVRSGPMVAPV